MRFFDSVPDHSERKKSQDDIPPSWCRENHVLPISNVQEYGVVVN